MVVTKIFELGISSYENKVCVEGVLPAKHDKRKLFL